MRQLPTSRPDVSLALSHTHTRVWSRLGRYLVFTYFDYTANMHRR
jgi:hypothetical protein